MPDDLSCCPDPDVVAAGGITSLSLGWSYAYVERHKSFDVDVEAVAQAKKTMVVKELSFPSQLPYEEAEPHI